MSCRGSPTSGTPSGTTGKAGSPPGRRSCRNSGTKVRSPGCWPTPRTRPPGGSPGHSAEALRRLLPLREELPGKVLLWVVDPSTVAAARRGATHFTTGDPPGLLGRARDLDGRGELQDPRWSLHGPKPSRWGKPQSSSRGQIQLVACSYPALTPDPAFYECVGLQPDAALAVMAKNMTGWMAAFGAPWERGLLFDGPGACTPRLRLHPVHGKRPRTLARRSRTRRIR